MIEQTRASLKALLDATLRAMREAVVEFHKDVVLRVEPPFRCPIEYREVSVPSDDLTLKEEDLESVSRAVYVDTLRALNKYYHISMVRLPVNEIGTISEHGQVGCCAAVASLSRSVDRRYRFSVRYMFKDPNENV